MAKLNKIKKYQQIRYKKHLEDWDTFGIIVGDEGSSKSNLGQWMVDIWQTIVNGACVEEDINRICMTGKDFATQLSKTEPMNIIVFDEAGELDSRRAMSKFNVILSQAYKVIRAERLFTILILPSFWDLESRFRKRRTKFLIEVDKRGHLKFWLKDSVRKICALNSGRDYKDINVVPPDFTDTFDKYEGVLAKPYAEMKKIKTRETKENVIRLVESSEKSNEKSEIKGLTLDQLQNIKIKTLWDLGYSDYEISKKLNIDYEIVKRKAKKLPVEVGVGDLSDDIGDTNDYGDDLEDD